MIFGLFGTNNFGDELFSKVITDSVHHHDDLGVPYLFTTSGSSSARNVVEFEAIDGYPLPRHGFAKWLKALSAFANADGLLFGGGGLFNEVFLRAGIASYGVTLATAKVFGVPYIMHGVEIGYVGTPLGRLVTSWCLNNASKVICRNDLSIQRAQDLYGLTIERGVDINHAWLQVQMADEKKQANTRKKFIVNLQHSLKQADAGVDEILRDKAAAGFEVVFVTNDDGKAPVIKSRFSGFEYDLVIAPTIQETIDVWKQGDEFLTERFHFTMASLHANLPTTVILSSSKVRELMETLKTAGLEFTHLRNDGMNRDILRVEPSEQRAATVRGWAEASEAQLGNVIETISAESQKPTAAERIGAGIVLPFFFGILVVQYVLDKVAPLNRELDTSVT